MRKLTIDTDFRDDAIVLRLTGDLDFGTCGLLDAPLQTLQRDGRSDLVIDLSEVGFIDSTALSVLLQAHRRAVARGRTLLIRGAPYQALRLFQLTGTDGELTIEALGTAS
jgi:anti-sigma B factor antagonist